MNVRPDAFSGKEGQREQYDRKHPDHDGTYLLFPAYLFDELRGTSRQGEISDFLRIGGMLMTAFASFRKIITEQLFCVLPGVVLHGFLHADLTAGGHLYGFSREPVFLLEIDSLSL